MALLAAAEEVVKVRVQELLRAVCGGSGEQLKDLHWLVQILCIPVSKLAHNSFSLHSYTVSISSNKNGFPHLILGVGTSSDVLSHAAAQVLILRSLWLTSVET